MAKPADSVWEVRDTGADTNGGGFSDANKGATGVDYSQQAAAQLTLTDGATSGIGVTTFTSATGGFTNLMLGNYLYLASGTNATVDFYCITGFTDTNTVTLDRAPDDGVGGVSAGNFKVGGCLATPGMLTDAMTVTDNVAYVKAATYTLTTSTPGSGGPCQLILGAMSNVVEGYETTRGDLGASPVLDAGAQTSVILWESNNNNSSFRSLFVNLIADGNSGASNIGFECASTTRNGAFLCVARDCSGGFSLGCWDSCRAEGCTTYGFNAAPQCFKCVAYDCLQGFISNSTHCSECIAYGCGEGFDAPNSLSTYRNCVAYGNTTQGWAGNSRESLFINCVAVNNGAYGWAGTSVSPLYNCAGYNNTSGNIQFTPQRNSGFVTLTSDPFVDGANGDFRPNDTAGGGAELRGAGIGVGTTQTDNRDIGAVQHADPAGGGGAPGNMSGGLQ